MARGRSISFSGKLCGRNFGGICGVIAVLALGVLLVGVRASSANTSEICDRAAQFAARQTGVPLAVLKAITRSETGRLQSGKLRPWPWTVNMEGVGKWFASQDEALSYAHARYNAGARSFDVGCFQINYKWHGARFHSISEMFDPEANALYAARFLKSLYDEKNDWSAAAGAYHSRTKKYSVLYRNRFDRILASASMQQGDPAIPLLPPDAPHENSYPFFQSTDEAMRLGSLVPLGSGGGATASLFAKTGG